MIQAKSRMFCHRIEHYHFHAQIVELAIQATVEGLPGICTDHLSSILNRKSRDSQQGQLTPSHRFVDVKSSLITSLAHWLWAIFDSLPGYKLENDLRMQETMPTLHIDRAIIQFSGADLVTPNTLQAPCYLYIPSVICRN